MTPATLNTRVELADKIRGNKQAIAQQVTDEFFARHPDWLERYGARGRRHGIDDACYHQDFLASAIESGSTAPFAEYVQWSVQMLTARGIAAHFVTENLHQIKDALSCVLESHEQEAVLQMIEAGCVAAETAREAAKDNSSRSGLTRSLYLQAILQGQRKPAWVIVREALREGQPITALYIDVLQQSMYEVGRLWQANRITVAEEHMATAITQYVMAELYSQMDLPAARKGKLVITGVEGELHQVGANMVADSLELDGWDVKFLGTNMPHAGILKAVEDHAAVMLGVSVTMLFCLPRVRQLVADVRRQPRHQGMPVIVGGGAFRNAPDLAKEIGADGYAPNLQTAIDLVNIKPNRTEAPQ